LRGCLCASATPLMRLVPSVCLLDTIEALFAGLSNTAILRAELSRLFGWLKDKGVTTIVTGERGEGQLTRHGLEEYVSDCVILLDHRLSESICTRRLRVAPYRGSLPGTNDYPFLLDAHGISVLLITSLAGQYPVHALGRHCYEFAPQRQQHERTAMGQRRQADTAIAARLSEEHEDTGSVP
jgi:hypothetical protein